MSDPDQDQAPIVGLDPTNNAPLVASDPTNPHINHIVFRALVVSRVTNNKLTQYRDSNPGLVAQLTTIVDSPQSGKIIGWLWDNPVFIVPEVIASTGVNKQHAYDVIRKLRELNIVKRTRIKLEYSHKGVSGNRPSIHHLFTVNVNDAEDELVRLARHRFWEGLKKTDPVLREEEEASNLLIDVCRLVTDYYISIRRTGHQAPTRTNVLQYIKDIYPDITGSQRAEIAGKITQSLYKFREV